MRADLGPIQGLGWEFNRRIDNGDDSYVIPFPTCRPINMVFHGDSKFDYGHYGIHLGQEDRLTFLGPQDHLITAHFIDCRAHSATRHQYFTAKFAPTSARTLCIPPGVAHAFDALERITTLNTYRLFLPEPGAWLSGDVEWNIENDVINLPMEALGQQLPSFVPNSHDASDLFYSLIADRQRVALPAIEHEYPFTEDVNLENGQSVRLLFRKRRSESSRVPAWTPIAEIDGAGWAAHMMLPSGKESGFVPLLDARPFYVVDHGEAGYSHDAYGIHVGQSDHLTFVGPATQTVRLTMVDCRAGSPTLHARITTEFQPSPLRCLIIPNGVAHRFERLENVFTINQPAIFTEDEHAYVSGNDVLDWPADRVDFPTLSTSKKSVSNEFYHRQASHQREYLANPPMHATPIVLRARDVDGAEVSVIFKKRVEVQ